MTDVNLSAYSSYVDEVVRTAEEAGRSITKFEPAAADLILDGQMQRKLRDLVPISYLREIGAFFTGSVLRESAIAHVAQTIGPESIVFDPACGVGDLLLASAFHLPVSESLTATLSMWGRVLHGTDLSTTFIRAAKARLVLLAIHRGAVPDGGYINVESLFPGIRVGDGLATKEIISKSTHVFVNPPYGPSIAEKECQWASGKVSFAAVFMDYVLANAQRGAHIVAILPDVLRTGTRYAKWRHLVQSRCENRTIEVIGKFDKSTDVDVFTLYVVSSLNPVISEFPWFRNVMSNGDKTIESSFHVHVGPVVPHRHKKTGRLRRFIYAQAISGLPIFDAGTAEIRRFSGRVFLPPFIVLRRTSSPDQGTRLFCTLITGTSPVAVENHLILLIPRSGKINVCRQAMRILQTARVAGWLNERIRCRHLTVGSISEIPWK